MAKQTIYLFIRAFIIGILLNVGIQQVSEVPLSQQGTTASEQIQHIFSQFTSDTGTYQPNRADH